jgi:hypothetical protein
MARAGRVGGRALHRALRPARTARSRLLPLCGRSRAWLRHRGSNGLRCASAPPATAPSSRCPSRPASQAASLRVTPMYAQASRTTKPPPGNCCRRSDTIPSCRPSPRRLLAASAFRVSGANAHERLHGSRARANPLRQCIRGRDRADGTKADQSHVDAYAALLAEAVDYPNTAELIAALVHIPCNPRSPSSATKAHKVATHSSPSSSRTRAGRRAQPMTAFFSANFGRRRVCRCVAVCGG